MMKMVHMYHTWCIDHHSPWGDGRLPLIYINEQLPNPFHPIQANCVPQWWTIQLLILRKNCIVSYWVYEYGDGYCYYHWINNQPTIDHHLCHFHTRRNHFWISTYTITLLQTWSWPLVHCEISSLHTLRIIFQPGMALITWRSKLLPP